MTRLIVTSLFIFMVFPALAWGQNYAAPGTPAASVPSRYAPPQRTAQAATPAGQPAGGYPVRPVAQQQPIAGQQPLGQPPPMVQQPIAPAAPQQPAWVAQLDANELKWIDDVLRYWETRSDKIKLFECNFRRWDYDGGPIALNGKRRERTFAEGSIKYAQPDKGLYRVEKLIATSAGAPGEEPKSVPQNAELGEHWVCNGEDVYSFEASKKQVTVTKLPPEMRGRAIADGPLPFMFGAKAETIKARYWVRRLVAAEGDQSKQGKYWLEAVPRSRQDAQNFKMVRIVLDESDYLPESLEIFAPHYNPPQNDARQTYVFFGRTTRDAGSVAVMVQNGLDPLGILRRDFYEVKIPFGWKKVVLNDVMGVPAAPAGPPPVRQAEQPAAPQRPSLPVPR